MSIPTHVSRYRQIGGSWGLILPPKVREALTLRPGDLIIVSIVGTRAVLSRFVAGENVKYTDVVNETVDALDARAPRG
jgi:antitoxin component of MazEF toxin-antitoxin module